jgi:hypothetical protein
MVDIEKLGLAGAVVALAMRKSPLKMIEFQKSKRKSLMESCFVFGIFLATRVELEHLNNWSPFQNDQMHQS